MLRTPKLICIGIAIAAFFILFWYVFFLTTAPKMSTNGVLFLVNKGMSIQSIAKEAQKDGLVRSSFLLTFILEHRDHSKNIYAGTYRFDAPQNVFEVASKLASNDIDKTLLSITIPEGSTRVQIAEIIQQKIPTFDTQTFLELTKDKEGYLFPDTYLVRPDFSPQEFADLLNKTFEQKIAPLQGEIASSSFSEAQVITLASIIEREAKDETSMRTVSGILQKRMAMNMPLQTDAAIAYALDKSLQELTPADLKIETPYNTYIHTGLPPTPIDNPGLQSIKAVLDPLRTEYLYYITDPNGEFHYATTFAAHKLNIQKYLKNT